MSDYLNQSINFSVSQSGFYDTVYQIDAFSAMFEGSVNQLLKLVILMVLASFWLLAVYPRIWKKKWFNHRWNFPVGGKVYYFEPLHVLDGLCKIIVFGGSLFLLDIMIRIKFF